MQRRLGDNWPESHTEPEPWLYREKPVPHYYGDTVRVLLLAAAVIMLIGAPFYADDVAGEMPLFMIGALALVAFSAFTSPRNRTMLIVDAISAGIGVVLFETWALLGYPSVPLHVFILRQIIALLFLFAFYYSGKTVRAFVVENPEEMLEDTTSVEKKISDNVQKDEDYEDEEVREETPPLRRHYQLPDDIDD